MSLCAVLLCTGCSVYESGSPMPVESGDGGDEGDLGGGDDGFAEGWGDGGNATSFTSGEDESGEVDPTAATATATAGGEGWLSCRVDSFCFAMDVSAADPDRFQVLCADAGAGLVEAGSCSRDDSVGECRNYFTVLGEVEVEAETVYYSNYCVVYDVDLVTECSNLGGDYFGENCPGGGGGVGSCGENCDPRAGQCPGKAICTMSPSDDEFRCVSNECEICFARGLDCAYTPKCGFNGCV